MREKIQQLRDRMAIRVKQLQDNSKECAVAENYQLADTARTKQTQLQMVIDEIDRILQETNQTA